MLHKQTCAHCLILEFGDLSPPSMNQYFEFASLCQHKKLLCRFKIIYFGVNKFDVTSSFDESLDVKNNRFGCNILKKLHLKSKIDCSLKLGLIIFFFEKAKCNSKTFEAVIFNNVAHLTTPTIL